MNMDRERKKEKNRTIEYLELKYETDVQSGLNFAEVRHRQHICGAYDVAKEEKRIWRMCLKKECQNPFFFFTVYLCGISRIFYFPKKIQILLFFTLFFMSVVNIRTAFRRKKILLKKEEAKAKKVIVLRGGTFQRIPWRYLLRGDIVRLKRGEQVRREVISLKEPYNEYQAGQIFEENTGRAIVVKTTKTSKENSRLEEQTGDDTVHEFLVSQENSLEACFFKGDFENYQIENTEKNIYNKFSLALKKVEEQLIESLCIFVGVSFVIAIFMPQVGNMRQILWLGTIFFVIYIVGREVAQEVFRRVFIQKIKRRKSYE